MNFIIDSREQRPFSFPFYNSSVAKLDEGDYTLQELLDIETKKNIKTVRIERKGSASEIANNLAKDLRRFEAELQRLADYAYAYIVCEFSYEEFIAYPKLSNLPKKKQQYIRVNGKFLDKQLTRLIEDYGIIVKFFDSRLAANEFTEQILLKHYEEFSQ